MSSRSDKLQKVIDNFQTLARRSRDQQTVKKKKIKQKIIQNKQRPLLITKSSFSMTILFLPGKSFGCCQLVFVLLESTQRYTEKVNITSERRCGYKEDISVKKINSIGIGVVFLHRLYNLG